MKNILKTSIFCAVLLAPTLYASCFNTNDVNVKWTSFKTLSKIGVSGHFNDIKLNVINKNATSVKKLLENTSVNINLLSIDAKSKIKTSNILKYFVSNLKSKNLQAKIVKVYDKTLDVKITLNETSKIIPMKYKLSTNNELKAKGVIDALDFNLNKALNILNKNVAGHLNKGWLDIPIKFNLQITSKCI